ncbi:Follistatin-related protein 5 [Amphibalanus amphitrite]|uniref:Follistatin-related protein 5 n=1 Tax=Amphibalanus amphitrite TaxID=1232801 RepID=A0A6A4WK88_AMPAM|nr:Follistatin-related protein 5 [Amphibalanus amphitrite]
MEAHLPSLKSLLLLLILLGSGADARNWAQTHRRNSLQQTEGISEDSDHQFVDDGGTCLELSCGRGRTCQQTDSGAACVCVHQCPDRYKPVCGSDGMIYPNHCHLHRRACLDGRHIGPRKMEKCLPQNGLYNVITSNRTQHELEDTLLAYSRGQLERELPSGHAIGREYTISRMFSQYDLNNDGQLRLDELNEATKRYQLAGLTPGCDLTDLAHFDDTSGDGGLDINEFYTAFNKLYSIAMVSLDKALEVNNLSAFVGDNVEIKCDVTGSPAPRVIWKRSGRDLSHISEADSLRVFADAPPTSEVSVRLQTKGVGQLAAIECHVDGVPPPQEYVCGGVQRACTWGSAVSVGTSYVYISQPRLQRVLVVSRQQQLVVDVWVLNWRTETNHGVRTVEVIRQASKRRCHFTVHLQPINDHVDLVVDMLLPPAHFSDQKFRYGFVTHSNHRGMFKVDMQTLNFVKSVDLTPYNCVPQKAQFAKFSRGLEFAFDVRTPLNISDVTFHPSRTGRGYDLYATAVGVPEVVFIDLNTGQVQILTSVGSRGGPRRTSPLWGRPERPLYSAGRFQRHLSAADGDRMLVLNGDTQTENCEVAGLQGLGIHAVA